MAAQLSIFNDCQESVTEDWELVKRGFPFKYHLYRIDDNKLSHINTLFEGYNDEGYPNPGLEANSKSYVRTDNPQEILTLLESPSKEVKYQYIYTRLDFRFCGVLASHYDYEP